MLKYLSMIFNIFIFILISTRISPLFAQGRNNPNLNNPDPAIVKLMDDGEKFENQGDFFLAFSNYAQAATQGSQFAINKCAEVLQKLIKKSKELASSNLDEVRKLREDLKNILTHSAYFQNQHKLSSDDRIILYKSLAKFYATSDPKDYKVAFENYKKASDLGDEDSKIRLTIMYLKGQGIEKPDLNEAKNYFAFTRMYELLTNEKNNKYNENCMRGFIYYMEGYEAIFNIKQERDRKNYNANCEALCNFKNADFEFAKCNHYEDFKLFHNDIITMKENGFIGTIGNASYRCNIENKSQIEKLATTAHKIIKNNHKEDSECPICYGKINPKDFTITQCDHAFCSKCINDWISPSNSLSQIEAQKKCPCCREEITKDKVTGKGGVMRVFPEESPRIENLE